MNEAALIQKIRKYLATVPECFFWKEHSRYHRLSQGTLHCTGSQGRQKYPDKATSGYH